MTKQKLCTLITSWFCRNASIKIIPLKLLWATEIKNKKREVQIVTNENLDGSSENWSRAVRVLAGSERFVGCGFYSVAL